MTFTNKDLNSSLFPEGLDEVINGTEEAKSPFFKTPSQEQSARYRREDALRYAIKVCGKHTSPQSIVATALQVDGFLSGEITPTEEDLREELRLYADTIKSMEVTIENLERAASQPATHVHGAMSINGYVKDYNNGVITLQRAVHMRAMALGLRDDSTVTVGQVLREVDMLAKGMTSAGTA